MCLCVRLCLPIEVVHLQIERLEGVWKLFIERENWIYGPFSCSSYCTSHSNIIPSAPIEMNESAFENRLCLNQRRHSPVVDLETKRRPKSMTKPNILWRCMSIGASTWLLRFSVYARVSPQQAISQRCRNVVTDKCARVCACSTHFLRFLRDSVNKRR